MALPKLASAHVKWFAEEGLPARAYHLGDGPVRAWALAAAALLAIGFWLERKLKVPAWLAARQAAWGPYAVSVVTIGAGAGLLLFSLNGFVFAPNLRPDGGLGAAMLLFQALAGLMLLLGMYVRAGGLLLAAVFMMAVGRYGLVEMMDGLEMLGLAAFAVLAGRPRWGLGERQPWRSEYALPVLRVLTGLNLMVLAFSEKIMSPSLALEFLSRHHWNFMQAVGLPQFTDYWFAFSAGVTEALFGLFLLLGLVTRLTTVVLAVFLATTLVLLGPTELMGHLPHFSIAVALLVLGSGSRLKIAHTA